MVLNYRGAGASDTLDLGFTCISLYRRVYSANDYTPGNDAMLPALDAYCGVNINKGSKRLSDQGQRVNRRQSRLL